MVAVPHPLYLPNLAFCDFALFPGVKLKQRGCHFNTLDDIQKDNLEEKDFCSALESWKKCWDRCVFFQGEYFEGDCDLI